MRLKILLPILFLSLPAMSKPIEPVVDAAAKKITLGKDIDAALKQYNQGFQIWQESDYSPSVRKYFKPNQNQLLMAVVGDFNGDGAKDVVLKGHDKTNEMVVAVISDSSSYKTQEIEKWDLRDPKKEWMTTPEGKEYGLWTYLTHAKPGKLKSPYEKKPLALTNDAFEIQYFEKAAVLYYFDKGRFAKYTTSD